MNKRCTKVKQSKVEVTFWLVDKVTYHPEEKDFALTTFKEKKKIKSQTKLIVWGIVHHKLFIAQVFEQN